IRESDDIIESIGINKSIKKMEEADLILMVYDSSNVDKEDEEISSLLKNKKIIKVYNKSDLIDEKDSDSLYISALNGDINILKDAIISKLNLDQSNYTTPSINNARELGILENIKEQLLEIKSDINLPIDLLASRLKEVLNLILSITGEDYDFDMISEIFSRFCVGK
ncbi:MAG: hypothetical protein PUJ92_01530, partial [Bacilli bacterium]|nr:hypothetical protein [Bacilli bacterium]MDY5832951.1 hypothetical protein [Candidatus Onthovivens sp.]